MPGSSHWPLTVTATSSDPTPVPGGNIMISGGDFGDDLSYVIETSIDLGVTDPWGPAESGVAETAVLIPYTFPSGNPVRQFARLKVIAVP